jgi:hypothetical protein
MGKALGALGALFGLFGLGAVVCAIVWTLFASTGRQLDKVITTSAAKPAPLGTAVAPVRALSAPKVVLSNNVKIVRPGSTEQNASGAMKKVPCNSQPGMVDSCYLKIVRPGSTEQNASGP